MSVYLIMIINFQIGSDYDQISLCISFCWISVINGILVGCRQSQFWDLCEKWTQESSLFTYKRLN